MGVVRLHRVISFSCQDSKHPVKNLLSNSGPKPSESWLSSPYDKSGRIEAEFQLEKPSYIHYVDIGNSGSSSVEILVRLSSWPKSRGFVCLLPAVQMMSASECKTGINTNAVRMFTTDHLNPDAIKDRWDRVKVICTQSYCRDKQFGLSFLRFSGREEAEVPNGSQNQVHFDFTGVLKKPVPLKTRLPSPSTRLSKNSPGISRARVLLKAAQKKQATLASKSPVKRALFADDDSGSELETDFLCFLTSMPSSSLQYSSYSAQACLNEYEEMRARSLTDDEKRVFWKVYQSVFSQDEAEAEPPFVVSPASPVSSKRFYPSSSPRNEAKENGHGEEVGSSSSFHGTDFSFDISDVNFKHPEQLGSSSSLSGCSSDASKKDDRPVSTLVNQSTDGCDLPPEKRPKRKKKYITMKDMSKSPAKQRRLSTPPKKATPKQGPQLPPHSDFIQSDGSVPSTSRDMSYIDCPICDEPFHKSEIEAHAATCGDLSAMAHPNNRDDDDDDVKIVSSFRSRQESARNSGVSCHSDNFVECPVCGDMVKQASVQNHTNMCIENCIA